MNDKELFEQLRDGPFPRKGFDEQLRRRINKRVDEPDSRRRSERKRRGGWVAAASLLAVVLFGAWLWSDKQATEQDLALVETAGPSSLPQLTDPEEEAPPSTAMLVGLRKDTVDEETGIETNTYRTLLVVPEGDGFARGAENAGIWMPYGQNFWLIDNAVANGADQQLTAAPVPMVAVASPESAAASAAVEGPVSFEDDAARVQIETESAADVQEREMQSGEPVRQRTVEKLLFAGNKYISVLQSLYIPARSGSNAALKSEVWVDAAEALSEKLRLLYANGSAAHLTPAQLIGQDAEAYDTSAWSIRRSFGKWVGMVAVAGRTIDAGDPEGWEEIAVPLPHAATSDNELALPWTTIRERYPEAVDAFSSSSEDVLAIVTTDSIDFYANRLPGAKAAPSFRIDLDDNEFIVMVQWARNLGDNYIERWARQVESGGASAR